ncbi:AI-2E family transporter [Cribrihabitans neustonicus]|uniref:AI-2E family transporter n=1 Tax=Cribrihabitans neustonicus TaxID=1429085 RepID=UPI003B5BB7C2
MSVFLSGRAMRAMILILTLIAVTAALHFAKPVLAPVVFAAVMGIVISPLADRLDRLGVARVATAAGLLVLSVLLLVLLVLSLDPLISALVAQLPVIKAEIRGWVEMLSEVLRGIEAISSELEETVGQSGSGVAREEETALPTLVDALWLAPNFGAQMLIFVGTLFFFVLTRNELYAAAGPYASRLFRAERAVARYFTAISMVNAGLGLTAAAGLAALGVAGAWAWGLAAALLNFIPYLGPFLIMGGLAVAGITQFNGVQAVLPLGLFILLNLTESQFVTPAFVGRQLHLNPLWVFLAIIFGLWIWGPVGAIVALPVLLWSGRMLTPPPPQGPQQPPAKA